ncbi:MAG: CapA family protein [Myxococcales bacterium]|nr:CapA family protein [Myxococcales bacterium]
MTTLLYPWHYTLRWPMYHSFPSTRRHTRPPRVPLTSPAPGGEETLKVVISGDLMGLDHDRMAEVHPEIRAVTAGADLVVGNCEAPVIRRSKHPRARYLIRLSMGSDYLRDFFEAFEVDPARLVLSVANNHAGDHGDAGLTDTLERLRALKALPVGAVEAGASPIVTRDLGGARLGFAAWTQWMNRLSFRATGGVHLQDGIDGLDWAKRKAEAGIDCLIGLPHWEYEFQHYPRPETAALAARLAAEGFDVLAGCHPHVLQPMERLGETPCFYSLGNLLGLTMSWPTRLGALLTLEIARSGATKGRIRGYRLHPYAQLGTRSDARLVPLDAAPEALKRKMRRRLARLYDCDPALAEGARDAVT